ncbi:MAG: HAMP domain-containing protein [Ardenticatenaceae bacterium]
MSTLQAAVLRRKKMRGGLGRTLLTAFLLLALGPLSVMSVYTISRTHAESNQQQEQLVALLAESYRAQIIIASQSLAMALQQEEANPQWFFNHEGEPLVAENSSSPPLPSWLERSPLPAQWQVGGESPLLWVVVPWNDGWSGSTLSLQTIITIHSPPSSLESTAVYIQQGTQVVPISPNAPPLSAQEQNSIVSLALNDQLTLLVAPYLSASNLEQNAPDQLAATLVAAALVAALITTVAAAFITRRITRPIDELTQAAVKIARGDLKQRVQVKQDNELGIFALAFNTMASQLHSTLETLEERVEQRTEELRQANAQIATRARQLELTAEIGTRINNVHNVEELLKKGTALMSRSFGYQNVAIWLLAHRSGRDRRLTLRISTHNEADQSSPSAESHPTAEQASVAMASKPATASNLEPLARQALLNGHAIFDEQKHAVALPLRLADNIFGSMVLTDPEQFKNGTTDQPHLQILADTLAVAIENARAMEMEHVALEKLNLLTGHRTRFLGEMSHELSTALNSIIGFSQLMLKEVEEPLTDTQRSDLTYINRNGMHLLSLLDGLLEVIDSEQRSEEAEIGLLDKPETGSSSQISAKNTFDSPALREEPKIPAVS